MTDWIKERWVHEYDHKPDLLVGSVGYDLSVYYVEEGDPTLPKVPAECPERDQWEIGNVEDLAQDGYVLEPPCEKTAPWAHIARLKVEQVPGPVDATCERCGLPLKLTGIAETALTAVKAITKDT